MKLAMLRNIVILPGSGLVVIPAVILWLSGESAYSWQLARPDNPWMWVALAAIAAGLGLMARTMTLFLRIGEGTHAPWEPTRNLVAVGPYRHLRNPMISGAISVLLGEALLFGSLPLLGWAVIFAAANALYMPLVEEPGLERRFGEDYRRYKANVPPWVPRLTPWRGPERGAREDADAS
jgi:protein-S-isoprenylcysteine O-methyltransferase Ste14